MANFCRNSNTNHHVPTIWLPACRTRRALSIGVQFVEIRHCSEDVHSRSVFSSVPFRSVKVLTCSTNISTASDKCCEQSLVLFIM